MIATGKYSLKNSIVKLLKLPSIYAAFLAICFNLFNISLHSTFDTIFQHMLGAFSLLGMMIVGLGVSYLKGVSINYKFLYLNLIIKHVIWPIIAIGIVLIDKNSFQYFSSFAHSSLLLLSTLPLSSNAVVLATEFDLHPDQTSFLVNISHLLALLTLPLCFAIFKTLNLI